MVGLVLWLFLVVGLYFLLNTLRPPQGDNNWYAVIVPAILAPLLLHAFEYWNGNEEIMAWITVTAPVTIILSLCIGLVTDLIVGGTIRRKKRKHRGA